jgi:hypothetical protein
MKQNNATTKEQKSARNLGCCWSGAGASVAATLLPADHRLKKKTGDCERTNPYTQPSESVEHSKQRHKTTKEESRHTKSAYQTRSEERQRLQRQHQVQGQPQPGRILLNRCICTLNSTRQTIQLCSKESIDDHTSTKVYQRHLTFV